MDNKIEILSAKLRNDLFITAKYSESGNGETNNVTKECSAPAHDDLRTAFRKLTIHLALISEQIVYSKNGRPSDPIEEPKELLLASIPDMLLSNSDWEILRSMDCSGFSIGGNGDSEGVTLTGSRQLRSEKYLNLTAPFTKWYDTHHRYEFGGDLSELIEICKSEVYQYLFEGKHQPDTQLSLFPDGTEDTEENNQELSDLSVTFDGKEIDLTKKGKTKRGKPKPPAVAEGTEDF